MSSSPSPGPSETVVRPGGPVRQASLYGRQRDPHGDPQLALDRGDEVGRYVVLEKIGAGGMGIVYAAYDPELDRKIALKLLRPGKSRRSDVARARLMREAQALARVSHPGVITVHDVGTFGDQVFVAMEFVDGADLSVWIHAEDRTWRQILDVTRLAGEGLAAAHEAGLVHRDFKPENVLVGNDGRVRVLDFGLARSLDDVGDLLSRADDDGDGDGDGASIDPLSETATLARLSRIDQDANPPSIGHVHSLSAKLTQAGAVVGTPPYMAPEQHRGAETDARTDQFSFCIALYEALYGERPFAGLTLPEVAFNVLEGKIRDAPPGGSHVPAWVRRVLLRGLAVKPDERWPDMRSLLNALSKDPSVRRRRIATAVGGSIVVAGLVAAVMPGVQEDETCRGAERKLAGVWDDPVRAAVKAAFDASSRPYAGDAFNWVAEELDSYRERWVGLHQEACEATAIRKEQSQDLMDRQIICLERNKREVGELTQLLAQADDEVVRRSVRAVSRLPPVDPCADREALMAREAPLPRELAQRVEGIDAMLARARHLQALAQYDRGIEVARDALGAARAVDHKPSEARALVLLGTLQNAAGEVDAAEATLRESVWLADEVGADLTRGEAWSHLVWVVGVGQRHAAEAKRLHRHAQVALTRGGGDPFLTAHLHNNAGAMERNNGDLTAAIRHHRQALELRREHRSAGHPRIAESLINLASALSVNDQLEEADALLVEAQEIVQKAYGSNHPRVASTLHARGVVAYQRKDYRNAAELLTLATEIRRTELRPDHPDVASSLHDLGVVRNELEEYEAARRHFARAAELRELLFGDGHPAIANSLTGLGLAHLGAGDAPAAVAVLHRAVAIREKGDDPLVLAESQFALARAQWEQNATENGDAAKALAAQALDAYRGAAKLKSATEIEAWLADRPPL